MRLIAFSTNPSVIFGMRATGLQTSLEWNRNFNILMTGCMLSVLLMALFRSQKFRKMGIHDLMDESQGANEEIKNLHEKSEDGLLHYLCCFLTVLCFCFCFKACGYRVVIAFSHWIGADDLSLFTSIAAWSLLCRKGAIYCWRWGCFVFCSRQFAKIGHCGFYHEH